MKKFLLAGLLFLGVQIHAQQQSAYSPAAATMVPAQRSCGTMHADSVMRANNPSMGTLDDFEIALQQVINNIQNQRSMMPGPYNIPMIVHVIYNGEAIGSGLNLSQAQINSQFDVLNEDYNNTNADGANVPALFQPVRGSLQMVFKKALRDPAGNTLAEPGIDRVNRSTKGFTAPPYTQSYVDGTIKPATSWDPTKYFNVWVTNISGGLLGWAQFPPRPATGAPDLSTNPGAANTDGVVILYNAFGRVGNVAAPYNKGRTLTHEAGHFFGLRHIWADEPSCSADDYVSDTPQQKDKNFGCPSFPQGTSAAGGCCVSSAQSSQFMNYMDYTDDACMFMFSQGQATRMEAVVTSSPRRVDLTTSTVANPLIALDASISAIVKPSGSSCVGTFTPVVTLTNLGSSTLTSATITYTIDGTGSTVLNWTGSIASGATANVTLATATTTVGSHTFAATVSSPNSGTDGNAANNSLSQSFTITTAPATTALPLVEGFTSTTFVPTGWTLLNPDANVTWTRATVGGFSTTGGSAKMDNYSSSTSTAGQTDDLLTPAMDLSTANSTLKMTFQVAHAMYNTSYIDSLVIEVTKDCGSTWQRLYSKGGSSLSTAPATTSAFTPTATQWRKDSIMLGSLAGSSVAQFRFRSISGYGNNIYLDNINLNFTPTAAAPVAAFTGAPTTVCAGGTVTYTDQSTNSPTSWSWSFPGGTPATSTSQNPVVTYATAGTYNAVLTATNSTGSNTLTKTNYITVVALPSASASATPATICTGSSSTLNATGGTTYSWSPAATLSAATGASVSATPTATTTYTVTATGSAGCTKTATTVVTVNPLPVLTVTPAGSTVCPGSSSTLTVSGATTATWSPSTGLNSTSGTTVVATPSATTTYTVTGTNANGCVSYASAVVNVSNTLTVSIAPATVSICSGNSATLTASGATSYNWSPATGLSSTNTAAVTASPTTTTTYTVTGTSGTCTATTTRIVTVKQTPTINATASPSSICAGSSATIIGSGAGTGAGSGYSWSGSGLSSTTGASVTASPTSTTTYTVTGTNSGGCSNTSTVTLSVNPAPVVQVQGNTSVCMGSSTTLTASGATSYTWTSTGAQLSSTSGSTVTVTPTNTATVTVTGTSAGCSSTVTTTIVVNQLPVLIVSPAGSTVCPGGTVGLTASGASTYEWTPSSSLNGTSAPTVLATPTTTETYTVTGTSQAGCVNQTTAVVTVTSAPVVTASSASPTICSGSSTTLSATGASSYSWSPATGLSSISGSQVTTTLTSTTTYTVIGSNGGGCSDTTTVVVNVNQSPTALAGASPASGVIGDTIVFTNSSSSATSYSWDFGDGTTSTLVTPEHNYTSAGTYTVTLSAANGNCSSTSSIEVVITTPTGISEADKSTLVAYPNPTSGILMISLPVSEMNLKVFNSTGQLILSETTANSGKQTIDLSNNADGIYYIHITDKDHTQIIKVNLVK
jgi:PKD repeat protein